MNIQAEKFLLVDSHTNKNGLSASFPHAEVLLSTIDYQFTGNMSYVRWSKCWETFIYGVMLHKWGWYFSTFDKTNWIPPEEVSNKIIELKKLSFKYAKIHFLFIVSSVSYTLKHPYLSIMSLCQ